MIELKPHIGKSLASRRDVDLGQDRIFLDGEVIGYVGRKPNSPINLIFHGLPEATKTAVQEAVQAKYGGSAAKVSEPVPLPEEPSEDEAEG